MKLKSVISVCTFILCIFTTFVIASNTGSTDTLFSLEGIHQLKDSQLSINGMRLINFYTTQQTQTFCGIASAVMVLNALNVQPQNPLYDRYSFNSQHHFFEKTTLPNYPDKSVVLKQGLTLDELATLLRGYELDVSVHHAIPGKYHEFLSNLKQTLEKNQGYIIVNFSRKNLVQSGGGHFSPLAAINYRTQKVLMLDVARYKQPAFWVNIEKLWQAFEANDSVSGLPRGYLVIQKK